MFYEGLLTKNRFYKRLLTKDRFYEGNLFKDNQWKKMKILMTY